MEIYFSSRGAKRSLKFSILMFMAILSSAVVFSTAYAVVPFDEFAFQGLLKDDNGNLVTDTKDITLEIFTTLTGGTALWSETHDDLSVSKGIFTVFAGSVTQFSSFLNFTDAYFLQVKVADSDGANQETLSPRIKITAAPYSLAASRASVDFDLNKKNLINATSLNSTAVEISQTGTSLAANITNTGTGDSFRVNDQAGDTTPFIIANDGNVGIGTTNPTIDLAIGDTDTGLNQNGDGVLQLYSNNVVVAVLQNDGANQRFFVLGVDDSAAENPVCREASGELTRSSGGCTTSSIRYKQNVQDLNYGLEEIMQLRPVTYEYKTDPNRTRFGLIAEEVAGVFPEIIHYEPDDPALIQTYDRRGMHSVLTKAIQEQQSQIEQLQAEVATLKALVCQTHPDAEICQGGIRSVLYYYLPIMSDAPGQVILPPSGNGTSSSNDGN